ncbi:MAG TPA: L,D-transpeptidase family protein [Anaerolineae bacterium]|nr:L,D-transpeptidase family protein [Anaerolineae bacterium]
MQSLDRRTFLQLAGTGLIAPWLGSPIAAQGDWLPLPDTLGRVTQPRVRIYAAPDPESEVSGALQRDMIVPIFEEADTVGLAKHNSRWFRIRTGWVYSSYVQPVRDERQRWVVRAVPPQGFWGQISVPFTEARARPNSDARRTYRLYYASVHLIIDAQRDPRGVWWYRIRDDFISGLIHYARADHVRPIPPSEMSPLSPDVEDKMVEVDIQQQRVTAYEAGVAVHSTICATGTYFTIEGLGTLNYTTPAGRHRVVRKRPSRHMRGGEGRSDFYDLPGVPFCTYFTTAGAAIHGAYWHNDFGHPRSHGCVNVTPADALWFFRWSHPATDYAEPVVLVDEGGTPIVVT